MRRVILTFSSFGFFPVSRANLPSHPKRVTRAVGQRARSDTSMIEELVYPSNKMPPHLKCQVLSFLRIMWPNGFVDENRLRDWISHEEDHSISMMLVEKGVLISHTQVVWRYLDHAGETYKAYGVLVGGIGHHPGARPEIGCILIPAFVRGCVGQL